MLIRVGYEIGFDLSQPTATLMMLYVHPSRASSIREPERLEVEPDVPVSEYIDSFGNRCGRLFAPAGRLVLRNDAIVEDDGQTDPQGWDAPQHEVRDLPDDVLQFLLPSRYCEVDSELSDFAASLFNPWRRVGRECRRSATSSTSTFVSIICRRGPTEPPWRRIASVSASAAILRIWPSRSAAA